MMMVLVSVLVSIQDDFDDGDGGVLDGPVRFGWLAFKWVAIGLTVMFAVVLALLVLFLGGGRMVRRRRADRTD